MVASLKTYDVDHTTGFTYSLVGGRTDLFEIASGSSIVVKNGAQINFEANTQFTLRCPSDSTPLAELMFETMIVQVIDGNEAPTAVSDSAIATEAGGANNSAAGTNPSGNVADQRHRRRCGRTRRQLAVSQPEP